MAVAGEGGWPLTEAVHAGLVHVVPLQTVDSKSRSATR
jgi:hypothetical protein